MLELNNIVKDYISGDTRVTALKGINLRFRDSEFVRSRLPETQTAEKQLC